MAPFLLVAVGAVLGANARYWVSNRAANRFGVDFPYGTLIVNVSGSFAIGFVLATLTSQAGIDPEARLLVATGFLGGYTTFSAFSLDAGTLWERGRPGFAALYVVGSVALSIGGLFAGLAVARTLLVRA